MDDRSGDAIALLGMAHMVVLSTTEETGELYVSVETTADVAGCPTCGVRAVGHGRSVTQVRDLPAGGRPVRLVVRKRRWRCPDPDCPRRTFTETVPSIEGSLTTRAAKEICRRVGQEGHAVAQVARDFGVSWSTAMTCVRRHGEPLVDDPGRVGVSRS
ncbi:MAG: transposase family protein, partial [Acidimicrobiales bacterium]